MDYFDTRHNIEKIVHTELRKKHGDDAITQRLTPGMTLTTSAPADYVAAIGIAQQVARVAQSLAYDYAKKARGEGKPWDALAEPLGLSTDPDEYGNSAAEAAFELVAPKPSMRFDLVTVHWTCASCGQSITDKGPYNGHPDDDETGHADDCARHLAEVAAWTRAWGDE